MSEEKPLVKEAIDELNNLAFEANERVKKAPKTRDNTKGRKEGESVDVALVRKVFPVGPVPKQPYTLMQAQAISSWLIKEAIKIWLVQSPTRKSNLAPKIMNMLFQYTKRNEEIDYLKKAIKEYELQRERDSKERRDILSRSDGPDSATEELLKKADLR